MENWIKGSSVALYTRGCLASLDDDGVRSRAEWGGDGTTRVDWSEEILGGRGRDEYIPGSYFAEFLGRCCRRSRARANRFKHEISLCPENLFVHASLIMTAGYRFPVINLRLARRARRAHCATVMALALLPLFLVYSLILAGNAVRLVNSFLYGLWQFYT